MTQNKASTNCNPIHQATTCSISRGWRHWNQFTEFMLTLGLSLTAGCAWIKLFTKDYPEKSVKRLPQSCYQSQEDSYPQVRPLPQWALSQAPGPLRFHKSPALQLACSGGAQRVFCKVVKKGDWELDKVYRKAGKDVIPPPNRSWRDIYCPSPTYPRSC